MVKHDGPFPAGKLPADLLAALLPKLKTDDPRVLIGPRVGTDAAAISMGDSVIIVKSDPITFATEDAGWYLVNVNANDVACMGGTPKWLLVTALLPEHHTTEQLVRDLFDSLHRAAEELDISLVGGHTEITIGLDRPILIGSMLGECPPDRLIDPSSVNVGDAVLLCKGIAIEGTALLAREASPDQLSGIDPDLVQRGAAFLTDPGISVVRAAETLLSSSADVHALHDPTEGGLATALRELGAAANLGMEINMDKVLIYPETRAICDALDLNPLGLIASGALLAVVDADDASDAIETMTAAGIPCARIGTMTDADSGITATAAGQPAELPEFAVDEIARFFSAT